MRVIYVKEEKGFSLLNIPSEACTQTYDLLGLRNQRNKNT